MSFINRIKTVYLDAKRKHAQNKKLLSKQLLEHISLQLRTLSDGLEQSIEDTASGKYKAPDSVLQYVIQDRQGSDLRTEWHDQDYVSIDDVMHCAGYCVLAQKADTLGVKVKFLTDKCVEFPEEDRLRYIISISGWR